MKVSCASNINDIETIAELMLKLLTMSFQNSACNIHLDSDPRATLLVAICNNEWGSGLTSEMCLDDCLGNSDGRQLPLLIIHIPITRLSLTD